VSAYSGTIMSTTGENPDKTINRLLHPIKLSPATHALHPIKLSPATHALHPIKLPTATHALHPIKLPTATHAVPLNKTINGTCTLFL
jgi:hypothetical protein